MRAGDDDDRVISVTGDEDLGVVIESPVELARVWIGVQQRVGGVLEGGVAGEDATGVVEHDPGSEVGGHLAQVREGVNGRQGGHLRSSRQ